MALGVPKTKQEMKTTLLRLALFTIFIGSIIACQSTTHSDEHYQCPMKCEGDKTYDSPGICPVCKMDLVKVSELEEGPIIDTNPISDASIFNLTSEWKTQDNETILLEDLKGDVMVVVMIYTSCGAACPRLVADMKNIHSKVADPNVKFLLVSIDPVNDTPEKLKAYAKEYQIDGEEWTLLQGSLDDVREFSNVLSVKYKKISPIDFSHTNIISVFDQGGVLAHQQEGLGVSNDKLIEVVKELTTQN